MQERPTILVTPIYGWGWTIFGERQGDVPEPFSINPEISAAAKWQGTVLGKGHIFEGMTAQLSKRHPGDFDGHVSVEIGTARDGVESSVGYATLTFLKD